MKIQKLTALALALALLFALAACGTPAAEAPAATDAPVEATEAPAEPTAAPAAAAEEAAEAVTVRLAALTGPTAMGMAKIFSDADAGTAANDYEYALYGAADELTPQLLQGGVDIAAVPLNLASVLYNKTSGGVKLCAVGVLGVLYITEFNGETVQSLADLKGKTIYATGKGSTPEYFLRYLLAENGLDLDTDVTVEWKSEPSEVVALLKAENGGIAMLPQPYVTAAAAQLGEETHNIADPLGVQASRRFIQNHHAGLHHQHPGDGHSLFLPKGQRMGGFSLQMGHTGPLHRLIHPAAHLLLRKS